MSRKLPGSAIVPGTITVTQITGGLNDTTNASYAQANTARTTANDAYGQANTARDQANTARTQANTAYGQANNAYSSANLAYGQANAAYGDANTRLSASGGTLSGDLIITGNLTVSGNSTTLNTEVLTVEDAEVILLSNVASTPALNAGIIVNRGTSTNTFLRWDEALDEWGWSDSGNTTYYFEDLRQGLSTTNTTFGTVNTSLGTINTSYQAAYAQANTARNTANSAYGQANTATTNAGNAYDTANSAYTASNRLITQDLRTIAPNSHTTGRLTFGFTSYTNNGNASSYADYLHFRSYIDSSGGSDNLVMFHKSGIGMRIWQQTWNSSTAYSNYVDVLHSSNYSSYAVPLSGGTMTGQLNISSGGLLVTGNVGIGTASPSQKLDVVGNIKASGTMAANGTIDVAGDGGAGYVGSRLILRTHDNYRGAGIFMVGETSAVSNNTFYIGTPYSNHGAGLYFRHTANNYQTDYQSSAYGGAGNTIMYMAPGGNVGIGTDSPTTRLDVNGGDLLVDAFNVGDERGIFFRRGYTSAYKYNVSILAKDHNGNAPDGLSINGYDGISFCTGSNDRNEVMRIQGGSSNPGFVGIGTTSPGTKLHVYQTTNDVTLRVETTNAGSYFEARSAENGYAGLVLFGAGSEKFFVGSYGADALQFSRGRTGTEFMRITNGGNVGIGTNSPSTTLDVNGSISSSNIAAAHHMAKSRTTFTVGGSSSNYYPVIFTIWGGSQNYQYSSFIIERGGYEDPGYTGIGFSNMHAKFSLTSSGWGFASDYIAMDHYKGSFNAIAKWYQEFQTSRFIVWLRGGGTQYHLLNVVGTATLVNGNSGGTQLVTDYNTYTVESSVQNYATYTRHHDGTLWQDGNLYAAGNLHVANTLSKAAGSFKIDHPLPQKSNTNYLVHSFIEGPQADLYYSGKTQLQNGLAIINIDSVSNMTEGTFEALCRNIRCFVTNESNWDLVRGTVENNLLTIVSQNNDSSANVSWLVVGERKDKFMLETDWTDDEGRVIVEPAK